MLKKEVKKEEAEEIVKKLTALGARSSGRARIRRHDVTPAHPLDEAVDDVAVLQCRRRRPRGTPTWASPSAAARRPRPAKKNSRNIARHAPSTRGGCTKQAVDSSCSAQHICLRARPPVRRLMSVGAAVGVVGHDGGRPRRRRPASAPRSVPGCRLHAASWAPARRWAPGSSSARASIAARARAARTSCPSARSSSRSRRRSARRAFWCSLRTRRRRRRHTARSPRRSS